MDTQEKRESPNEQEVDMEKVLNSLAEIDREIISVQEDMLADIESMKSISELLQKMFEEGN